MIKTLTISNYKSIKSLRLDPKRVNIFIGEHNSGKSNILEALTWFSVNGLNQDIFSEIFRFKNVSDFFYDFDGTKTIEILTDELSFKLRYAKNSFGALMNYFEGIIYRANDINAYNEEQWMSNPQNQNNLNAFHLDISNNKLQLLGGTLRSSFRTYSFKRLTAFKNNYVPYLNPPFGDNIPAILQSNTEWKKLVTEFFKSKGFRLITKPVDNEIEMAKDVNGDLYSFPYQTISETMQRFIFFLLALETNKNSILVLDEPESNMFPFFIKDFAERIADDESNQYFIATHNPYLLGSLLEKTPLSDVAVFITRMEDYMTTVTPCTDEQIEELLSSGSGAFFNLNNIID